MESGAARGHAAVIRGHGGMYLLHRLGEGCESTGLMRSARAVRAQNRVFGGLLMAVGAGLFFVKRGGQHA